MTQTAIVVKKVNRCIAAIVNTLSKCFKKHMPPIESKGHPLLERQSIIEKSSELAE
jgi:hypothetical protein